MRTVSLKHLLTKPALLIAAGLVLLGATSGRTAPLGESAAPDSERSMRPTFDVLCRCLTASLASDDESGFGHVGLHAAFGPSAGALAEPALRRVGRRAEIIETPHSRLRVCRVGPSPPR